MNNKLNRLRQDMERIITDDVATYCEVKPQEILSLLDTIDELKSALSFYACQKTWAEKDIGSMMNPVMWRPIDKDCGKRAREALKKLEEVKNEQ